MGKINPIAQSTNHQRPICYYSLTDKLTTCALSFTIINLTLNPFEGCFYNSSLHRCIIATSPRIDVNWFVKMNWTLFNEHYQIQGTSPE